MAWWSAGRVYRFHHEPVLGTVLTAKVTARNDASARAAEVRLLAEITRLEAIFSVYDPISELNRWKRGEAGASAELTELLRQAWHWQHASHGLFNPAVGELSARWRQAEHDQVVPDPNELKDLAAALADPAFTATGERVSRCDELNFNAMAKGMVVDLATASAMAPGVREMMVNIGGDLRHIGPRPVVVGVEDPRRPYDNAPPMQAVAVHNQGMATSGLARRGFRIADQWFSHVIDPRTGWPVDRIASASIVASDSATADALATVLSVLPSIDGLAWLDQHATSAAALVIDGSAIVSMNSAWKQISRSIDTSGTGPARRQRPP